MVCPGPVSAISSDWLVDWLWLLDDEDEEDSLPDGVLDSSMLGGGVVCSPLAASLWVEAASS